jgi:hypothetical protein
MILIDCIIVLSQSISRLVGILPQFIIATPIAPTKSPFGEAPEAHEERFPGMMLLDLRKKMPSQSKSRLETSSWAK